LKSPTERDELDTEVEVDDRSYFYQMKVVDMCDDTSKLSNMAKTILLEASTGDYQRPLLNWSKYQGWENDVEYYEVQIEEEDGSFTSLHFSDDGNDTMWLDKLTDLNQRASYCYRVIGHKKVSETETQVVSVSNVDCSPVESRLYVPNAFTPNGDLLNDYFVTPGIYIKEYNIRIFNRWGEKVFESDDMYVNWDGRYNGEKGELEAYMYVIESIGVDGVKRSFRGTVNLLR
jgi:gliding motility-associated-like protein